MPVQVGIFFSYPQDDFPFVEIVTRMFDANEPLEYIHKLDEESSQPGYVVFDNDQGTLFHKTFYNSPLFDEFKMIYKKWIKQVIGTLVHFILFFMS